MKKMNKIIAISSIFILIISLSSCSITEALNNFNSLDYNNYVKEDDDITELIEDIDDSTKTIYDNDVKEELDLYVENYEELYGYQMLSKDSNYGALLTDVYESFYYASLDALTNDKDYQVVTKADYEYFIISTYEYKNANYTNIIAASWVTLVEENPLFYFLYTGYTVTQMDNSYYFCLLGSGEYSEASYRNECNKDIIDMVNEFNDIYLESNDTSDINKATLIHDYICNKIEYAYDSDGNASTLASAHNILGVAQELDGVCECYAKVYLFLSYRIDLNSLIVIGYSGSQENGHAWNVCQIEGVWYGVDVTWDDSDEISYDYFLVSSSIMNQAHSVNSKTFGIDFQVPLPALSNSSYDTSKDKNSFVPNPYTGRGGRIIIIRF